MFRIAICDDKSVADDLSALFRKFSEELHFEIAVDACRSYRQLGEQMAKYEYGLVVLETALGGVSGLDAAKRMRAEGYRGEILFYTADASFALEAYGVFPVGYVVKPSNKKKFYEIFSHINERYNRKPAITLRGAAGGNYHIYIEDILYIEVFRTELDVHSRNGVLICNGSLVETYTALPPRQFYRSHRSYIVNLAQVSHVDRYQFVMSNGDSVTVAKNRYAEAKRAFNDFAG